MKLEADLLVENAAQVVTVATPSPSADAGGKLGVILDGTMKDFEDLKGILEILKKKLRG